MPRITPIHWKKLECIFLKDGFQFKRQEGSHKSYIKQGIIRPVVIPSKKNVQLEIILNNMKTAKMSRERYFKLLAQC